MQEKKCFHTFCSLEKQLQQQHASKDNKIGPLGPILIIDSPFLGLLSQQQNLSYNVYILLGCGDTSRL